ncbi:hypothetical protein CMK11_13385 [Candidatus Poribacteria bacterium]|nr:hypothetical protein [Candidatus Poribacteria bacterium]
MRRMASVTFAILVVSVAGCGRMSLTSSGHLALDLGGASAGALNALPPRHAEPVLQAFDAQQNDGADLSDPNSRAGANCAGGVCAIF